MVAMVMFPRERISVGQPIKHRKISKEYSIFIFRENKTDFIVSLKSFEKKK